MPRRLHRRWELVAGILLGLALGLIVVAVFVFVLSEQAVDAPSISGTPASTGPLPTEPTSTGAESQAPGRSP